LHLGCGPRRVPGWLNVDLSGSDFDLDLASGSLPWPAASVQTIAAQHVIEHLDFRSALLPLLRHCHRILAPGGQLWLSCPDIEKICRHYLADGMHALIAKRKERMRKLRGVEFNLGGSTGLPDTPPTWYFNAQIFQNGEHLQHFDYPLLCWTLQHAGFSNVRRVQECDLLAAHPEFPPREDDDHSLAVLAIR
ncbi:MAG: methyltransferase domain-containing protein, partial [Bdellovibrionaceae bacterium]|nr:methyltransferase domain-containing protein [Pseudobdellovibrionaceae bacterium]